MTKQKSETVSPEKYEADYMKMRAEHYDRGLRDIRLEGLSDNLGSVAVLVGAVGNEAVSGAGQDDEVASDREALPAVVHHVDVESVASAPAEITVNISDD